MIGWVSCISFNKIFYLFPKRSLAVYILVILRILRLRHPKDVRPGVGRQRVEEFCRFGPRGKELKRGGDIGRVSNDSLMDIKMKIPMITYVSTVYDVYVSIYHVCWTLPCKWSATWFNVVGCFNLFVRDVDSGNIANPDLRLCFFLRIK